MPDPKKNDAPQAMLDKLPAALVRQFAEMAALMPRAEGDGGERLLEQILGSVDAEDLDAAWRTKDPERLVGEKLLIESAEVSESDFTEGLGIFLVVHAVRMDSGEDITFSTGSVSIVAQLVRAFTLDAYPLEAKIVRAERPSKAGYYPQHLEIIKASSKVKAR